MLLALHGLALGIGGTILVRMLIQHRRNAKLPLNPSRPFPSHYSRTPGTVPRPLCWLAIRSVSLEAVQTALGLNRAQPCSWAQGLAGDHGYFISPRVNGWVIVTGNALPTPTEDVDATFMFLCAVSRKLGHVQYFYASRQLQHHAWARLDDGCVTRGYAWIGETVWNQGVPTRPETEAGLRIFDYGAPSATLLDVEINLEKVPLLAARWSLDPAEVKLNSLRQHTGIAGESTGG